MDTLESCPACAAPNAPSAILRNIAHFCCRFCGLWYSTTEDAS